jgi:hypothetical protein
MVEGCRGAGMSLKPVMPLPVQFLAAWIGVLWFAKTRS